MHEELRDMVAGLGRALRARGWTLATAESCTGGLIGGALTSVSGSSDWYLGGVISYANMVKERLLAVPRADLAAHGAVSEEVVRAMARGALEAVGADLAVAVSGVAGPGGGSPDKPVGTVWLAWAWPGQGEVEVRAEKRRFQGDRDQVRASTVEAAVKGLLAIAQIGDEQPCS